MTKPVVAAEACTSLGATSRTLESFPNREIDLGSIRVMRALPIRERRMIGPWCFLDRAGPLSFEPDHGVNVGSHPHTGLQTVTWLLDGEMLHHDSLGNEMLAHVGSVNIMTAGIGIAHAEETPRINSGRLNAAQLWVALPDASRNGPAFFASIAQVPVSELPSGVVKTFAGSLAGATSTARDGARRRTFRRAGRLWSRGAHRDRRDGRPQGRRQRGRAYRDFAWRR